MKTLAAGLLLLATYLTAGCGMMQDSSAEDAQDALDLLQQKRIAEARLAISRAIDVRDDAPEYYLIRAQIETVAGSNEGAFLAYSDALALDPIDRTALEGVSRLGLQLGRLDESVKATDLLLTIDPTDSQSLVVRGLIEYIKKRYDKALEYADKVLAAEPDEEAGMILRTRALFMSDRVPEAKETLSDYERRNGSKAGSARTKLEIARFEQDRATMEAAFSDLIGIVGKDIPLAIDQANFQFKLGQNDAARENVMQVLQDGNSSPGQIGDILAVVEEYDATPWLVRVVSASETDLSKDRRTALAALFIDHGFYGDVERLLGQPANDDQRALRARNALLLAKSAQAEQLVSEVLASDEDNCIALTVAARISLMRSRPQQSIRLGQRAASECPTQREAWIVTAMAFSAKGDAANTRRVFTDGIRSLPQDTTLTRKYSEWLLGQGADREAIAIARVLTRNAPAKSSAWLLYLRTCRMTGDKCADEAAKGFANSRNMFAIDPKPGDPTPNGLFGRFVRR